MGFSLALSTNSRLRGDHTRQRVALSLVRRGGFLILQGYVMTWLVFYDGQNLQEIWAVDVLHCLGLSLVALIPLTLARSWPLAALTTVAAAAVSPWAGSWVLPSGLAAWITGSSGISYFPFFPFIVYALAGLAVGQIQVQFASRQHGARQFSFLLAVLGTLMVPLLPLVPAGFGIRFPRPQFLMFSLALILFLTAAFSAVARWPGVLHPLTVMGRTAMMIYVMHHVLGFRLFYHMGWVSGHSWMGQYGVFDPASACLLLVLLLGILYGLAELWLIWRPRIGPAALVRRWVPRLAASW
jgi:hypothetical protein